eukprot:Rmarinus@m.28866
MSYHTFDTSRSDRFCQQLVAGGPNCLRCAQRYSRSRVSKAPRCCSQSGTSPCQTMFSPASPHSQHTWPLITRRGQQNSYARRGVIELVRPQKVKLRLRMRRRY